MNKGKKRATSHIKGEQAVNLLKRYFPDYWVVREYTPDYGIDLSVELFNKNENNYITMGEHIFFQVKGTADIKIKSLKIQERNNVEKEYSFSNKCVANIEVIEFVIETDLLVTVEKMGSAVPVILCVVDLKTENSYFVCLNDYIEKIIVPMDSNYFNKKNKTIYIPKENKLNSEDGVQIVEWYAKRPKLYALFNKINYQKRELVYTNQNNMETIITHFLNILLRSDAWSAQNYFGAMYAVKREIDYYIKCGITEDAEQLIDIKISEGVDVDKKEWEATYCAGLVSFREVQQVQSLHKLWDKLCLMGDIFEDVAKEAFLPTCLGNAIGELE
ncbi:MAG: DUF4365 domain-containing protein [Lachnospiraceae bacterium]|nr:DUF4365 domain-containing protein [Lachnospiraceae bacterium]